MRRYCTPLIFLIAAILLNTCSFGADPATLPQTSTSSVPVATDTSDAVPSLPGDGAPVTITFGGFNEDRGIYEALIAQFEQDHPEIRVQFMSFESITDGNIFRATREVMSAVDVAEMPASAEAIAKGWVRDLTPLMDADATFDRTDFNPGVLEGVSESGHSYMLPRALHVPLIFYNRDLWTASGLKPPAPGWTWEDLKAAAEHLAQKRGGTPDVYGLLDEHVWLAWDAELIAAGVALDQLDAMRVDDPKIVGALERMAALVKSGAIYAPDPRVPVDPATELNLIRNHQIAMWSPDLCCYEPLSFTTSFAIGIAPFPEPLFSFFSSIDGYSMSNGTRHPEAAWRWLSFLSSQDYPAGLKFSVDTTPARKSIAEQSGYWKRLAPENAAALQKVFNPRAARRLIHRNQPALFDDIDRISRAVLFEGQTAQAALSAAQHAQEQRLAQQAPPSPSPDRISVATPAVAPAGATSITFGVPGFAIDPVRRLAATFNAEHTGVFVSVRDILPSASGMPRLADVTTTTDCFAAFGPPNPATITATLDLRPLIDADTTFALADYPPALLAPFRQGGGLYGLPGGVDFRVLHYNRTAFTAAGVAPPSATWTLEDLLRAAQQLTRGTGTTKQYGFAMTGDQTREVLFFLDRYGAAPITGSGAILAPNVTDPQVVQAVQRYLDLLRSAPPAHLQGYSRKVPIFDASSLIASGQVGMWFDFGTHFLAHDPSGIQWTPGFDWAIAPPPLGGNPVAANDFFVRGLYISAHTPHVEACWSWLKALSNDLSSLGADFPSRTTLAESDAFTSQSAPGVGEVYHAYRTALERASQDHVTPEGFERPEIDYYWFFQAIDDALQGQDLERGLAAAQMLTQHYLACVRGGATGRSCALQVDPDYHGWKNATPTHGLFLLHVNALEDRPLRTQKKSPVPELEPNYILESDEHTMHFFRAMLMPAPIPL
jgi:ABC-type glycerol-3-phosphate transport system substrate-binding protein